MAFFRLRRNHVNYAAAFFVAGLSAFGAGFENGQAARAVIGQASFSSTEPGLSINALSISGDKLYAADRSGHVLTFDLSKLPGPKDTIAASPEQSECRVCGFAPESVISQRVQPGIAAISVFDRTVVVADAPNHRVLIWRDASDTAHSQAPDVVLTGTGTDSAAVTASTLVQPVSVAYDGNRLFVGDAALHRVLIWNALPTSATQAPDAELGQPDFTSPVKDRPTAADTIDYPAALASDGVNLFVADSRAKRIVVFSEADTSLRSGMLVNDASLTGGVFAPGALIDVNLPGLTQAVTRAPEGSSALPTELAGVQVIFDGMPLPLLEVSTNSVRAQLPYDLGTISAGSLYVHVNANGDVRTSNAVPLQIAVANPGIYGFPGPEPRSAMALHFQNGSQTTGGAPATADNPMRPGETVIVWCAGLGDVNQDDAGEPARAGNPYAGENGLVMNAVTATIDGVPAEVTAARLPQGAIGVYEVAVVVPPDLEANQRAQLVIAQNGYASNTVVFPVRGVDQ